MPELVEQMYCSQQIVVPPKFPFILKKYCKAAIKTQPYDLLRWSYEYFAALAANREPPVKLRLEYPIYSTEGGLTKGCLKVMVKQLGSTPVVSVNDVRTAWKGFCLDPEELHRILCLCEVYLREDEVPFLHFIAVAGGLLTKTLTHTMILLCEALTKEPDGGSAAVPVEDFLTMYKFLAPIDVSKDVKYLNGYKEGINATPSEVTAKDEEETTHDRNKEENPAEISDDDSWKHDDEYPVQTLLIMNDHLSRTTRLSIKLKMPITERAELSISTEAWEKEKKVNPINMRSYTMLWLTLKQPNGSLTSFELDDEGNGQHTILAASDTTVEKAASEDAMTAPKNAAAENLDQCSSTTEIPVPEVTQVYCVPGIGGPVDRDTMQEFENYAVDVSKLQADLFMPRNIRHFMCPPFENYPEPSKEEQHKEEGHKEEDHKEEDHKEEDHKEEDHKKEDHIIEVNPK